ncbi:MAG TPA: DUF374 domain-containing protein [Acidiphilium sp.]|uniref:lysophospholipid acyltransferase family protein n=2 Tax=unclassified Acidiphilium TaxID=2617493 RepID=UPI000BC4CCBD|nr:DUF374 domain-containing protein [Acidiphilium sp.]OYV55965.1 MAG: hypothetical protein B7Z76_07900 [Acidiphilium sp. 20-67-58]HQT61557.1 DUF374 domain-containing protein [Acidiphilium sp.]HQU09986.1 DUF374 domain-containing protein [Acidiphilium sp.]
MTPPPAGATATAMIRALKSRTQSPAVQARIGEAIGAVLGFSLWTTRWRFDAAPLLDTVGAGAPVIVACWHECLPSMPAAMRALRRPADAPTIHMLASRHRDGQLVVNALRRFGLEAISASSSRGGAAGMLELARLVRAGHPVVITPDGPRGPRRRAAAGVAQLAALTGAAVVCAGAATSRAIGLDSWDSMRLPLPFGRGALVAAAPIAVPRDDWATALPQIEAEMSRTLDEALARCRRP